MILTIFVVWLVLAALAALFVYCCSVVSNGPRQELRRDEFPADALTYFTTSTGREHRLSDSQEHLSRPSTFAGSDSARGSGLWA